MTSFKRDFHTDYDLNDPELNDRWDELVPELHNGCPVAHSNVGEKYWVVNGYQEAQQVAKDWQTYSSADGFMVNRPEGMPYFAPAESDPPLHNALRRTLEPFLRPGPSEQLAPAIRDHANRLIDSFIDRGEVELVSEFANPLPQMVFGDLIAGMPYEDMEYLATCFSFVGPEDQRAADFQRGAEKIESYLKERQQAAPRGDIVDALLAFEHDGYSWADKVGTMSQLFIGGITTTGFAFSGGIHHLATHPVDRKKLTSDLSQVPRAITEFLRMFTGVFAMARRVTTDTELAGCPISAGDRVLLSWGAASRDPRVMSDPDQLDISRTSSRHLAFGGGVHRCIGSPLALVVLRCGYEEFLKRIPEFTVPDNFVPAYETGSTRHMVELPLRFTPGNRASDVI
ncbi:hypothetical protein AXA44_08235 [Rhodococcus sp. SC4]|nr:hypothetical protein AXA44_08235 [Rhodococcus sp. SC4]